MIDVKVFTEEGATRVQITDLSGSINNIMDETAALVATVVMNIYKQGGPEGVRPKEFEQFVMKEVIKRMKEAVSQLKTGEAEVKDMPKKKIIEPKKRTLITKDNGTNNGFLN